MTKAFDSVSLFALRRSLERIKVPTDTIDYIIDLFEERKISVITAYGASDFFTGKDGIDQGETISPLLWRIFYDPLLCKIQNSDLGYTMREYLDDNNKREIRIAASAFADDTLWIGSSREQLQQTINVSNEFFELNDIQINGSKSELIIINSSSPGDQNYVTMGDNVKVAGKKATEETRFLGIWIRGNKGHDHTIRRLKDTIKQFNTEIHNKKLTTSLYTYLVNRVLIPKLEYLHQTAII